MILKYFPIYLRPNLGTMERSIPPSLGNANVTAFSIALLIPLAVKPVKAKE